MNLLQGVRNRAGAAIAAVLMAVCFLAMGAFLTFYISPQQAIEWRQIRNLPELDAAGLAATPSDTLVAITGRLEGNEELLPDGLVAFVQEEWNVTPPRDDDDRPKGSWRELRQEVPALSIATAGGAVATLPVARTTFGGSLTEWVEAGSSPNRATYDGQQLPDGSLRTRGLRNGDLVTVVGRKATTGEIVPNRLFGGDRVQLVDNIRTGARVAFIAGIVMMICSPAILVIGVLGGLFGRGGRAPKVKIG